MVSPRDITEAKRKARDRHINDDGSTESNDIFTYVPEVLGVEDWHRVESKEEFLGKEYIFRSDDHYAIVTMERDRGEWVVKGLGELKGLEETFPFQGRKHAEAFLVEVML